MAPPTDRILSYPQTRRDESFAEVLHGVAVKDPYRWLEDPDSAETAAWVEAQNSVTNDYLANQCGAVRPLIRKRVEEMYNYAKFGCPFQIGEGEFNRYYFFKNDGLQNQAVMYSQRTLTDEPTVFIDPNLLSADGTTSMGIMMPSEDGRWFAYGVNLSGSDWTTIHIRDVATGQDLPDVLEWVKFSGIAWTHDHAGFFYQRFPAPASISAEDDPSKKGKEVDQNVEAKIYYHRRGTPQSEDVLIHEDPENPKHHFGAQVTDDGRYLLLTVNESCDPVNKLYYADLQGAALTGPMQFHKLVDNFEALYSYLTNEGEMLYLKTNLNAPRYKVIRFSLSAPDVREEVIPESPDVLSDIQVSNGNYLVAVYLHHVQSLLSLHELATGRKIKDLPLPTIGDLQSISCRKQTREIFYKFVSFVHPGTIFRYDFSDDKSALFKAVEVVGHDPDLFVTEQTFYTSKDGTRIPMFLLYQKNLVKNGDTPTLLYGYGGFNITMPPSFSVSRLTFVRNFGGIFALANIRGGGEYGDEWHKAGIKGKKQNVFDDFHAAAEHLVASGFTRPARTAIMGGSNGGLLVGAVANQRPDLYGCGVAQVGVLDMLRFHKFTIGHFWQSDYGSPDLEEDFQHLLKYSPYHCAEAADGAATYPSIMLATGDHDDRVVPLHSFKFISALQHKYPLNRNPLLIRIETKAGHGAGKPTSKVLDEWADEYAFMANEIGAVWTDS